MVLLLRRCYYFMLDDGLASASHASSTRTVRESVGDKKNFSQTDAVFLSFHGCFRDCSYTINGSSLKIVYVHDK